MREFLEWFQKQCKKNNLQQLQGYVGLIKDYASRLGTQAGRLDVEEMLKLISENFGIPGFDRQKLLALLEQFKKVRDVLSAGISND